LKPIKTKKAMDLAIAFFEISPPMKRRKQKKAMGDLEAAHGLNLQFKWL
jgi:hypothetical protein